MLFIYVNIDIFGAIPIHLHRFMKLIFMGNLPMLNSVANSIPLALPLSTNVILYRMPLYIYLLYPNTECPMILVSFSAPLWAASVRSLPYASRKLKSHS